MCADISGLAPVVIFVLPSVERDGLHRPARVMLPTYLVERGCLSQHCPVVNVTAHQLISICWRIS